MGRYSVAIRTLGTSPFLKEEIESVFRQSILPDKVVLYIAEGYPLPSWRVNSEMYVYVHKGMVAQRALDYEEIESDYVLLLDDDVVLEDDAVEKMLRVAEDNGLDCVVADTYLNHEMSTVNKIYNILANSVFPRFSSDKAIKINKGSFFSYINNPQREWYRSESGAGPASLWKREVLNELQFKDELWMDRLGFAYGDDQVMFNKLPKNGYSLGMMFNNGISHLDGGVSSKDYKKDPDKFYKRSIARYLIWYRTCYNLTGLGRSEKWESRCAFYGSIALVVPAHIVAGVLHFSLKPVIQLFKGLREGHRIAMSPEFQSLPNYILRK